MTYVIIFFVGVISSLILDKIFKLVFARNGYLRIDSSDPEKDLYRIEIDDLNLSRKKYVILKVDNNAKLSQN